MQKPCFKCGETKSLDDFYVHPRMADGYLNKCKACTKRDVAARAKREPEKLREYEARRYLSPARKKAIGAARDVAKKRDPVRFAEYQRSYYERHARRLRIQKKQEPAKKATGNARYDAANPEKRKAHRLVKAALASGELRREGCEGCKSTVLIHAHHDDYAKPLVVRWLCPKCHGRHHRKIFSAP
jgi:hypothetical protein